STIHNQHNVTFSFDDEIEDVLAHQDIAETDDAVPDKLGFGFIQRKSLTTCLPIRIIDDLGGPGCDCIGFVAAHHSSVTHSRSIQAIDQTVQQRTPLHIYHALWFIPSEFIEIHPTGGRQYYCTQ